MRPPAIDRARDKRRDESLDVEALVVGAGPVGLCAALALARRGIRVCVVDSERGPAARSYALALHPSSLRLLADLGVIAELLPHGHRLHSLVFHDGPAEHARLEFGELGGEYPFVLVVPQQILESVLDRALAQAGVDVRWSHKLTSLRAGAEEVTACIELTGLGGRAGGEVRRLHAAFVIGADGCRSTVRSQLGIELEAIAPSQLFAVFEFGADTPAGEEVRVVLEQDASSVLWPLGKGWFRWSFQLDGWGQVAEPRVKSRLEPEGNGGIDAYLAHDELKNLIGQRARWFDAAVGRVAWSASVRFERRLAKRFGRGRVWLAGDAAHLAGPIGVHSMNVGLREGHELARLLASVLREDAPLTTLEEYERARQREWRHLLGAAGTTRPQAIADYWVTLRAPRIPACVPASGEDLDHLLRQLGLQRH